MYIDREETRAILKVLKAAYPAFYKDKTKEELSDVLDLWSTMFADDSAQIITEAVKSLLTTLKFPPTIADVKEKILLLTRQPDMTESEAWARVKKAISYYYAADEFEKLPDILKKLVGSPNQLKEWSQMEVSTLDSVEGSNFKRSYTARVKQDKEFQLLPSSSKEMIFKLSEKFKMPQLNKGD